MSDCKVCLVEHQAEIHSATVNIRRWLREDLRRKLQAPAQPQPPSKPTERPRKPGREDLPRSA